MKEKKNMQIFEIFLNPETKEEVQFKTFFYEPTNIYEKQKGNLYIVGQLNNALPQNVRLLDNLAQVIKTGFYNFKESSKEKSLKQSLKKGNEFLEKLVKDGNVGWISNLNLIILSIKDFDVSFSKHGNFRILISREGEITNIDKNLQPDNLDSYPLKIFRNIVLGKLVPEDRVIILSKKVFDFFEKEGLIQKIADSSVLDVKDIKEILKTKTQGLLELSGICILGTLSPNKQKISERIILEKRENYFDKIQKFFKNIQFPKIPLKVPKIKISFKALQVLPRLTFPSKPLVSGINLFKKFASIGNIFKKASSWKPLTSFKSSIQKILLVLRLNAILIMALIFFVTAGFLASWYEQEYRLKKIQESLNGVEAKVDQAQVLLVIKDEKKAKLLLKEAWDEIKLLEKTHLSFKEEILPLRTSIEKKLLELNKLKEIENPKLVFEFDRREFIPQRIIIQKDSFYFFSPYSQGVFKLKEQQDQLLSADFKFNEAVLIEGSILFFSKPDKLINLKDDQWGTDSTLIPLSPDFSFDLLSSFGKNLYFLSKKTGEIAKYSLNTDKEWSQPQAWLKTKTSHLFLDARSMAIDGSIWILKDNLIQQCFAGQPQKTITPDIFPSPRNLSKIWTSSTLKYLFILEPEQNRIIILNKSGDIIQQFQSPRFDNLKDFAVSREGKTIYLLNGQRVYEVAVD